MLESEDVALCLWLFLIGVGKNPTLHRQLRVKACHRMGPESFETTMHFLVRHKGGIFFDPLDQAMRASNSNTWKKTWKIAQHWDMYSQLGKETGQAGSGLRWPLKQGLAYSSYVRDLRSKRNQRKQGKRPDFVDV